MLHLCIWTSNAGIAYSRRALSDGCLAIDGKQYDCLAVNSNIDIRVDGHHIGYTSASTESWLQVLFVCQVTRLRSRNIISQLIRVNNNIDIK